jgi:hypothetical protein
MSGMSQTIYARRMSSGRWRLYEVEDQALMHWRGPNAIARVVRDLDGEIVNFATIEEAERWARTGHYPFDGEWPKCKMCGYYYRLAEDAHMNPTHCEQQRRRIAS